MAAIMPDHRGASIIAGQERVPSSGTSHGQQIVLRALDLPEPPRFLDFTLPDSR